MKDENDLYVIYQVPIYTYGENSPFFTSDGNNERKRRDTSKILKEFWRKRKIACIREKQNI